MDPGDRLLGREAARDRALEEEPDDVAVTDVERAAIEAALALKDAAGSGETVVVGLGGNAVQETLRTALAMGVDRAVHLWGAASADEAPEEASATRAAKALPAARKAGRGSDGAETIAAPMLGTFYAADGPSAEPFVEVGAEVEPDTVVGIIEVMKMMNSVRAGVSGTIVEVCAENAQLVEEGEPLFRVQP